jgi:hypothetical protein
MNNSLMSKITIIHDYDEQIINFPSYRLPEKQNDNIYYKYEKEVEKNKQLEKELEIKNKEIEILKMKVKELSK